MNNRLLIGVVTAECYVDFQAETMKGIVSQAFKSSCDIAVISSFHNFFSESCHKEGEKEIFRLIMSRKIDGFLYDRNTFYSENIRSFIDELLERSGKPVMLLDSGDHKKFESTAIDDRSAFEEITDHLIEAHGYRRIYCLTGPKKRFLSEERLNGYRIAMKKHGIPVEREYCIYGDFWVNAARELAADIISGKIPRPEAVVCGNDHSAISLTEALTEGGLRVPEDIAVTGYDDSEDGRNFTPSITSFRRPNFQLGAEAFRRLYRIITGKICVRVGNENVTLRLGESCGCHCRDTGSTAVSRRSKMRTRYMSDVLKGDMLFDISSADRPERFADRLDNYTYCIYKMRRMTICLTKNFIEKGETGGFDVESTVKPILRKTAMYRVYDGCEEHSAADILTEYGEGRAYPVAYYITPLHSNEHFFGYAAVSFGKDPVTYDELYMYWTNFVNTALDRLRIKMEMERKVSRAYQTAYFDRLTGLRNRSGIEHELGENARNFGEKLRFIRIQLTGIEKIYYSGGEGKFSRMMADFGGYIGDYVREGEIFGLWGANVFVLVTDLRDRELGLYSELVDKVVENGFGKVEGCDVAFNIGTSELKNEPGADAGLAVQRAAVNRVYSYTAADTTIDPQFERLCLMREEIAANPEQPWSIQEIADRLFISKSYLQKIYKTYFGKGIIEELISFRMERAKKLLTETDMTVTEIARECGYSTYNYFVRQFRTQMGMSPNELRAEHQRFKDVTD